MIHFSLKSCRITRLTMDPDMLAIKTMDPGVPVSTITFAAACALKKTPLQLTLSFELKSAF